MAKRVKAGSYWRTLEFFAGETVVLKALEDGWAYDYLQFEHVKTKGVYKYQVFDAKLYRCKKDGSWYQLSPVQKVNTQQLSLQWQIKGALASLERALRSAGLDYEASCIPTYRARLVQQLEDRRVEVVAKARAATR